MDEGFLAVVSYAPAAQSVSEASDASVGDARYFYIRGHTFGMEALFCHAPASSAHDGIPERAAVSRDQLYLRGVEMIFHGVQQLNQFGGYLVFFICEASTKEMGDLDKGIPVVCAVFIPISECGSLILVRPV